MSADDGIRLREIAGVNGSSYWVAYHYIGESYRSDESLSNATHYHRYQTLEQITQSYREAARDTEYGFDIQHILLPVDTVIADESPIAKLMGHHGVEASPELLAATEPSFGQALASLINRYSKESESGTPDHILARYLERQLWIFNETITDRASWRNESVELPALYQLRNELGTTVTNG